MAIPDVLAALQASAAAVLAAQRNIFETRRQVFQSRAAVIREKRLQLDKEIEGLKAQETAVAQRVFAIEALDPNLVVEIEV
jgi:HlyD family secretion protein